MSKGIRKYIVSILELRVTYLPLSIIQSRTMSVGPFGSTALRTILYKRRDLPLSLGVTTLEAKGH